MIAAVSIAASAALAAGVRQLSMARRKRHPLVLIAADVDDLKGIHDRFGHAVGDQALVAAAAVLRHTYREADQLYQQKRERGRLPRTASLPVPFWAGSGD